MLYKLSGETDIPATPLKVIETRSVYTLHGECNASNGERQDEVKLEREFKEKGGIYAQLLLRLDFHSSSGVFCL